MKQGLAKKSIPVGYLLTFAVLRTTESYLSVFMKCLLMNGSLRLIKTLKERKWYKTKDYCKVKFSFKSEDAETIEILGLNSDWKNAVTMSKKKDGSFAAELNLPKDSTHEFKYLVNETRWLSDPEADKEVPNAFGGSNSVIVV